MVTIDSCIYKTHTDLIKTAEVTILATAHNSAGNLEPWVAALILAKAKIRAPLQKISAPLVCDIQSGRRSSHSNHRAGQSVPQESPQENGSRNRQHEKSELGRSPMKPALPPDIPGNTEAEKFDNAVRRMFSASKEDLRKAEAKWKRAQARKKRTKKT